MLFALSPGCIAWLSTPPPYAMFRTDLDFFEFLIRDCIHYQKMLVIGIDVCIAFDPSDTDKKDGAIVGFILWGGASCVVEGKPEATFPRTLESYVTELRKIFREKFAIDDLFGEHADALDRLVHDHSSLPVLVVGNPPEA